MKNKIQDLFYILAFEVLVVLVYLYNLHLSYSYYVCHCTIFFQIFSQLLCIFLYSEYIMKRKILFYLIVLSFFFVPIRFTSSLPSKMKNVHTVFQIRTVKKRLLLMDVAISILIISGFLYFLCRYRSIQ